MREPPPYGTKVYVSEWDEDGHRELFDPFVGEFVSATGYCIPGRDACWIVSNGVSLHHVHPSQVHEAFPLTEAAICCRRLIQQAISEATRAAVGCRATQIFLAPAFARALVDSLREHLPEIRLLVKIENVARGWIDSASLLDSYLGLPLSVARSEVPIRVETDNPFRPPTESQDNDKSLEEKHEYHL